MHSIIRLCILVAAVFVQAAPSNANVFGERGDPTPSDTGIPPDSEVVEEEKCCGCKGKMPKDELSPDDSSKDGPFVLRSGETQQLIEHGKCKGPDDDGKCTQEKGCELIASYYIMPAFPHNGDGDKPKVTWEVHFPGINGNGPRVETHDLKKHTQVLPGQNTLKPTKWDCDTEIKIVVKWKKGGIDRSRTKRLVCTKCNPPKKK